MDPNQYQPDENNKSTMNPAPMQQTQPVAVPSQTLNDRRSYLAMMLLATLAFPTGLARAYRGESSGWIRFWIFVGSYVLLIIPIIGLLAGLAIIVLWIWGIVDIFILKNVTVDSTGQDLLMTPTDKKWGKGFFIFMIVSFALVIIGLIVSVFLGVALLKQGESGGLPNTFGPDTQEYRLPSQDAR